MPTNKQQLVTPDTPLLDRVVAILEGARANVVRSVNSEMVIAYWLVGQEIVEEEQKGAERAKYGERLIEELSWQLTHKYGKGFSITNLRYFRTFYLTYSDRIPEIRHMACGDLESQQKRHTACGETTETVCPNKDLNELSGFHPNLGWSHYRTLMKVKNIYARSFYEIEAAQNMWSVAHLERQICSFFYERLLKSRDKAEMLQLANEGQVIKQPIDAIKAPYILEFLDMPDSKQFHESDIESAIIDKLQMFLLELGKGFSFVARQKRMRFDDEDFYIDLVFYNYILKCFVLIDLKIGKLTHQDIGQMDSYVRMCEEHCKVEGDNPTVGLILCSQKNEAIARYSVLNESKQIFASKYMLQLPTEKELQCELQRERRLIEEQTQREEGNI